MDTFFRKNIKFQLTALMVICLTKIQIGQTLYTYDAAGNRRQGIISISPPLNERSFTPIIRNQDLQSQNSKSKQLEIDFGISVFPTQVNEILSLTILAANENAPAIVSVFDNLGKEIYNIKVQNSSQQQINFSNIKNGFYNLCINIKNQQVNYKVVKGK